MKRIMVNLDLSTAEILETRAAQEKRSASNYIALLVERDLRAAGLIGTEEKYRSELLAIAEDIGLPAALDTLRARARRAA